MTQKYLLTGGDGNQLLPALRRALNSATAIDIAVSFIRSTGLNLLFGDIDSALRSEERTVNIRILTSDYMCITDPHALRRLMLLSERGASVKVFQTEKSESFHLKSYILIREIDGQVERADAFVGSSNISEKALTDGLEWNYHLNFPNELDSHAAIRIKEIRDSFNRVFAHSNARTLQFDWIEKYELRYKKLRESQPQNVTVIDQQEPTPDIPPPLPHQNEALDKLNEARSTGVTKGLVVLATGLGKTYLAGFDVKAFAPTKTLFVAHREEILLQAEEAFLTILPKIRVGRFNGTQKDENFDILFASVQTIGRKNHLQKFSSKYFDYIIIDEFHHAAAASYKNVLEYFTPKFLLGLTATPDRSDGSDILRLCDDNLIYRRDLYDGINDHQLSPFSYYGVYDSEVDYEHIPWRNGKFDPEKLSTQLATRARANHALKEWHEHAQKRTLAFCASRVHADYMAAFFEKAGVTAASVHSESVMTRSEGLEALANGRIKVLFSVDLFNEGVDLPEIDTVMMLRPTESKILFLQQLGRGLRLSESKSRLVVLDFVGNHHSFLNRPELLFGPTFERKPSRSALVNAMKQGSQLLPDGCYVNYDLRFIEFMESLSSDSLDAKYVRLKESLGRRPTLTELWQNGANPSKLRQNYGSWWEFIDEQNDIQPEELEVLESFSQWFRDLTVTNVSKSYKLVLLSTVLARNAIGRTMSVEELAEWARAWFERNKGWSSELPEKLKDSGSSSIKEWRTYWHKNPVTYWCTKEKSGVSWFTKDRGRFNFKQRIEISQLDTFISMTKEINEWRLAQYRKDRLGKVEDDSINTQSKENHPEVLFFPNIKMACGHFKSGTTDAEIRIRAPLELGQISESRHFIARASGDSMNGGAYPILDGDYLLFEQMTQPDFVESEHKIVALESRSKTGENQYLLREASQSEQGDVVFRANNPAYEDLGADSSIVPFARLVRKVNLLEALVGSEFMREEIPGLFGKEFNTGIWQSGHVVLQNPNVQVLLVTLNKQGKSSEHQYHDYFIDDNHFHWQSQNSTGPEGKRGLGIIEHQKNNSRVYLFIRTNKLRNGKASPFKFYGEIEYQNHTGSKPMSVKWKLLN